MADEADNPRLSEAELLRGALDHLRTALPRMRKYLPGRTWPRPTPEQRRELAEERRLAGTEAAPELTSQQIVELDLVQDFQASLSESGSSFFVAPDINPTDPPDILAKLEDGGSVGIEVTELVSEKAIRENEKGHKVYAHWSMPSVLDELDNIISKKDGKTFLGGPFQELVLLIHTQEMTITPKAVADALAGHQPQESHNFSRIYLFFSYYTPGVGYPWLRLK